MSGNAPGCRPVPSCGVPAGPRMPLQPRPPDNTVTDSAFDKEIQTLLATWPLPIRSSSGMAVFLRSFIIAELEDSATFGGQEPSLPIRMLTDALKGLQAGQDHPVFQPARTSHGSRRRGRPPTGARRKAAIRFSVRYRLSAEQGIIEDREPKQAIGEAFSVGRRTVERWFKEHCTDVEPLPPMSGELAKQLLKLAGAVYASALKKLTD